MTEDSYREPNGYFVETKNYFKPGDLERVGPFNEARPSGKWSFTRWADGSMLITQPKVTIRRQPAWLQGWRGITRGQVKRWVQTERDRDGKLTKYIERVEGPFSGGEPGARLLITRAFEASGGSFKRVHLGCNIARPNKGGQTVDVSQVGLRISDALPEELQPGRDLTAIDGRLPRSKRPVPSMAPQHVE